MVKQGKVLHGLNAVILSVLVFFSALAVAAQPLNINTATPTELAEQLSGIGEVKAAAIVKYRDRNGGFASVDELRSVKGIGDALLERNRALLRVEPQTDEVTQN